MKLIQDIYRAIKIAMRFYRQQHATLAILNGTYIRQAMTGEMIVIGTDTTLSIQPHNSLYRVTRTDYVANKPECVQTWLATYGYTNMQLTDVSFDRYIVFDTVSKSLYLTTVNEQGDAITELFIKNM